MAGLRLCSIFEKPLRESWLRKLLNNSQGYFCLRVPVRFYRKIERFDLLPFVICIHWLCYLLFQELFDLVTQGPFLEYLRNLFYLLMHFLVCWKRYRSFMRDCLPLFQRVLDSVVAATLLDLSSITGATFFQKSVTTFAAIWAVNSQFATAKYQSANVQAFQMTEF